MNFTLFLSLPLSHIWLIYCSIFTEERLERLTKGVSALDLEFPEEYGTEENLDESAEETSDSASLDDKSAEDTTNGSLRFSQIKEADLGAYMDEGNSLEHQTPDKVVDLLKKQADDVNLLKKQVDDVVTPLDNGSEVASEKRDSGADNEENYDVCVDDVVANKESVERPLPNAVLPLLRYYQYESSESSSR